MFSIDLKRKISSEVQRILKETNHPELPDGEVKFILHVDGEFSSSWANITNNKSRDVEGYCPANIMRNLDYGI